VEIEVLPARRRWGRCVLMPGKRYRGHSFSSVQRCARLEQAGVLVRPQGWAIVAVG
jgi:hypothetical protein